MSIQQHRPNVGLGIVITHNNCVLIGKRIGAHGSDTWSIPGGHVEFGESWQDCARREVQEETGLAIQDVQFLGVTDDFDIGEDKHYVTIFMKAACEHGEPTLCEPEKYIDVHWCRWEDIPTPRFSPLQKLMDQGVHPFATYVGKLVRDRIPELINMHHESCLTHQATPEEYKQALRAKLIEEVMEFLKSEEPEELADILEVIHSLTALKGLTREKLLRLQQNKRHQRGGFDQKLVLDETRSY